MMLNEARKVKEKNKNREAFFIGFITFKRAMFSHGKMQLRGDM